MFELLSDPNAWLALATLVILEIILGIDNIIFLSLVVAKLPKHQQNIAQKLGLSATMLMRILLLFSLAWTAQLSLPLFYLYQYKISTLPPHELLAIGESTLPLLFAVSSRDMVLFLGGLFLIWKGIIEIKARFTKPKRSQLKPQMTLRSALIYIIMLDLVFSLDSVITAIGLSDHLFIMTIAVVIAVCLMMLAAKPISNFVDNYPTIKMLALVFLILVGVILITESLHFAVPKGYMYFALFFALTVEGLNLLRSKMLGINR